MTSDEKITRLLPAAYEAEQGILGSFARDPVGIGAMLGEKSFTAEHFSTPQHRAIFDAMMENWREGKRIERIIVTQKLRDSGLTKADCPDSILDEIFHFPTSGYAREYAEAVEGKFIQRQVIAICAEYGEKGYEAKDDPRNLLSGLGEAITRICGASQNTVVKTLDELLKEKIEQVENGAPDLQFVPTGIERLDKESPLALGDMPLISGERKAGKSILSVNIAINMILEGRTVLYFSLEDRTPKVVDRIFSCATRIPQINHNVKKMNEGEMQRIVPAMQRLHKKQLIIRDDVYDLSRMLAVCRQMKAKHPTLSAVVVDYAQLVRVSLSKTANREQEVASVSRAFRLLAMELNVAMIVLCQLNKDGDTRESKALEQDCTAMWKVVQCDPEVHGKRMIVIPFQRNGDSGIFFPITFLGHIAKIENYIGTEDEAKPAKRSFHKD